MTSKKRPLFSKQDLLEVMATTFSLVIIFLAWGVNKSLADMVIFAGGATAIYWVFVILYRVIPVAIPEELVLSSKIVLVATFLLVFGSFLSAVFD